jgi:hypothetical protein
VKRYSKISGMTIVKCDRKDCPAEFRSCSVPQMIDFQLQEAGWSIIELEIKNTLGWERKDLCVNHRPTRGGTINQRHWREKAIKGQAGSVSGHSRIAH